MTVCIAAACENGTKAVIATDRLLTYAGVSSDSLAGKMVWIDDWLVLYAGTPATTAMIIADLREGVTGKLTAENARKSFKEAFQRRKGRSSSFTTLSSFDMTLETFKREGRTVFGDSEFRRISKEISEAGHYFNEQMLIVGWGATPQAIMLYEIGAQGDGDHHMTGVSAIGTGSEVALSTIMFLGQARYSSLPETLYSVAAAKFASEKSEGESVGRKTSMCVTWKRTEKDDISKPPVKFLTDDQVQSLYTLWDRYGRPRIADQIFAPVVEILRALGMQWRPSLSELRMLSELAVKKSHETP